jgi:hypothetical protein
MLYRGPVFDTNNIPYITSNAAGPPAPAEAALAESKLLQTERVLSRKGWAEEFHSAWGAKGVKRRPVMMGR